MGLTADEAKALETLQRKAKEPDTPRPNASFSIDLSDDKAYERAISHGILDKLAKDDDDDGDGDDDDDTPRRNGFFGKDN